MKAVGKKEQRMQEEALTNGRLYQGRILHLDISNYLHLKLCNYPHPDISNYPHLASETICILHLDISNYPHLASETIRAACPRVLSCPCPCPHPHL